jgi:hypothetical protein
LQGSVSLAVDLDEDLPLIYGDSPQIEQNSLN